MRAASHGEPPGRERSSLCEQVDKYLGELGDGAALPEGYGEALADAQAVRAALSARPLPVAPCHCDPLCENFVDDAERRGGAGGEGSREPRDTRGTSLSRDLSDR